MKGIKNLTLLNIIQPKEIVHEAFEFFKDTCTQMHFETKGGHNTLKKSDFPSGARVVLQEFANSNEDALKKLAELRSIVI